MDKILADGRGVLRESVSEEQLRDAIARGVPEVEKLIEEQGTHLLIARLGDEIVARLRCGDLSVPLRIAEILNGFAGDTQLSGEIMNALQISFPIISEIAREPGGNEFLARMPERVRGALAGG
jgi:hypothetical protein